MIDKIFAEHFANEWIDSWNSHDLDRILSHYTDDFEMSSPLIVQITGESSGTLKGKQAVGDYWAKALARIPDLRFELAGSQQMRQDDQDECNETDTNDCNSHEYDFCTFPGLS